MLLQAPCRYSRDCTLILSMLISALFPCASIFSGEVNKKKTVAISDKILDAADKYKHSLLSFTGHINVCNATNRVEVRCSFTQNVKNKSKITSECSVSKCLADFR